MVQPLSTTRVPKKPLAAQVVFWFAALGPIGNLIPVPGVPDSFRFYYLLLVPAILLHLHRGLSVRTVRTLLLLSPLILYMMISSIWFYVDGGNSFEGGEEGNPLFRFALLMLLLLFTVLAGDVASRFSIGLKIKVVLAFLKGYFVSVFVGYVFFVGFYTHVISLKVLEHFEILVQFGFGLLRFSPGSYPNEYGIVSSFALSILTLLFSSRCELTHVKTTFFPVQSSAFLAVFYCMTFGALFLATTRAAYISYGLCVLYIMFSQGGLRRAFKFSVGATGGVVLLLLCIQPFFDVLGVFVGGYRAFFDPKRPASGRLDAWTEAYSLFIHRPLLGAGFSSVDMMHNVYLQLFFGLGVLGFSLLLGTALILYLRRKSFSNSSPVMSPLGDLENLLLRIRTVALIHILWFALSNHNLNHFLTWFAVLIALMAGSEETATAGIDRMTLSVVPAV